MEGREAIAVKAERRWRGVGPREHSCDHLQHDRVLHRRAALRRCGAGKVQSGPAKVVRLKFGPSSHELLDCLHIVASHGVVQARDLRAGALGGAFAFRAERHCCSSAATTASPTRRVLQVAWGRERADIPWKSEESTTTTTVHTQYRAFMQQRQR